MSVLKYNISAVHLGVQGHHKASHTSTYDFYVTSGAKEFLLSGCQEEDRMVYEAVRSRDLEM